VRSRHLAESGHLWTWLDLSPRTPRVVRPSAPHCPPRVEQLPPAFGHGTLEARFERIAVWCVDARAEVGPLVGRAGTAPAAQTEPPPVLTRRVRAVGGATGVPKVRLTRHAHLTGRAGSTLSCRHSCYAAGGLHGAHQGPRLRAARCVARLGPHVRLADPSHRLRWSLARSYAALNQARILGEATWQRAALRLRCSVAIDVPRA
jgi:hypothetical protein